MLKQFLFLVFLIGSIQSSFAQIKTDPGIPVSTKAVTITFNSAEESKLGYFTGDLYAHTGLITSRSTSDTDWKYVIESWGNNTTQPKLTNKGNGIYELIISPDLYSFYSVDREEEILKIALVFRSSDASQQTNNLYIDIYKDGLSIHIVEPKSNAIYALNKLTTFTANASEEAVLKLFLNETKLAESTGTSITTEYTFTESKIHWLIAEATTDTTVRDSVKIFVRSDVINETLPNGYKKGINYTSDKSAALVLWAPLKEFVWVSGDFNNWEYNNNYLMKKDGDFFWLDITGLEAGKEYAFQYFIDGNIRIADPYAEKILDPWNDLYIPEVSYPNLKAYPEGKTEGIVAVLQTDQESYNWQVSDFQVPEKGKMVIYELLIRDFTAEHSYQSVIDNLDYLEDLNINVLELMPVNEFENNSSWGYNPSFYFAPDKFYGPKNKLKELIDQCHKRGIAVVMDMVLNHSYGQSPFVQMYMDNWQILPENPWYNEESPNSTYSWGFDFNHEREVVQQLVDSVNSFWMKEYKVDGFRFDFTKGFTQTPGDGWAYDASRIATLKRMADEIWVRNPQALVILEHLADNREETELANHGMMLWGNMHGSYQNAAAGDTDNADLSGALYSERGWNQANLVSYAESHDEERIMYTIKNSGASNDDYNIKNQKTALDRIELNSLFNLLLPGPKMIWQFGERGYDLSINRCEDGTISNNCRTASKPSYWQYLNNPDRIDLLRMMASLNALKQTYNEFSPDNFIHDLTGAGKWFISSKGSNHAVALGNFDIRNIDIDISFPVAGKYYEFFSGDSLEITSLDQSFNFEPGEYRLYSSRKYKDPDIGTDIDEISSDKSPVLIYPNPASSMVTIESSEMISKIEVYSLSGELIIQKISTSSRTEINVNGFTPGMYITKVYLKNSSISKKLLVK